MLIYKIILFQFVLLFIHGLANCQIGYNKHINGFESSTINLDDIIISNDQLVIRGNIYIDSLDQWGAFIAGLDTNGYLIWHNIVLDSTSHLLAQSPSRFIRLENSNYAMGIHYYDTRKLGIMIFDSVGNLIRSKQYNYEGFVAYPKTISSFGGYLYMIGIIQRFDGSSDLYVLKTDDEANFIWFKFLGSIPNDEFMSGNVLNNNDGTFTISCAIYSPNYYQNVEMGWRKPWIFQIDTSGKIISEWIGDKNDVRTGAGGSIFQLDNGDWIISSTEYKSDEKWNLVLNGPTLTKLDANYNLLWKTYLTEYEFPVDYINDMEFDPEREEIILSGKRIIRFSEDTAAIEGWLIKLSNAGEVIWTRTDTLLKGQTKSAEHALIGVELSSSGSIYAAGTAKIGPSFQRGWIVKITNDGCIDTLCTTTSLAHQMKSNKHLVVFPNPSNNYITISLGNNSLSFDKIELFDEVGRFIDLFKKDFVFNEVTGEVNLFVGNLPSGVYFTRVSYPDGLYKMAKFIKM